MKGKADLKANKGGIIERTDILKCYFEDISKYDVLTPEEEKEIFKRIEQGDESAKNKLIEANQRYVFAVAKRYNTGSKIMDLIQEGNLGLMTAIDHYDPSRGVRFLSYARYFIEREINMYLINEDLIVKKSNNNKTVYKINKVKNKFFTKNGRYPTSDELMEIFNEKFDLNIKDKGDLYDLKIKSINNTLVEDDDATFEDSSVFNDKTALNNEFDEASDIEYRNKLIQKMLSCLDGRAQIIIKMSFGIGYDRQYQPQEIAEMTDLGITGERVRQIRNSAVKKLKKAFSYAVKSNI